MATVDGKHRYYWSCFVDECGPRVGGTLLRIDAKSASNETTSLRCCHDVTCHQTKSLNSNLERL